MVTKTRRLTAALAIGLGAATAAPAATLDFLAEGNRDERGVADGTVLTFDGVDVTFTSSHFAYFDGGDAGLGVCQVLGGWHRTDQCVPPSDDNVTTGEAVTLGFDAAQTLSEFRFRDASHNPLASEETLLFGVNGGPLAQYTFGGLNALVFSGVQSATFAYDDSGNNSAQFYVESASAVAAVPLPATAPLIAAALGAFGLVGRRRRSARR